MMKMCSGNFKLQKNSFSLTFYTFFYQFYIFFCNKLDKIIGNLLKLTLTDLGLFYLKNNCCIGTIVTIATRAPDIRRYIQIQI